MICFYKPVYLNCLKITRDNSVAEDLTHDVFVRAFKYKTNYDPQHKFIFWLIKISTNVCLTYLNKKSKERYRNVYIEELDCEAGNMKQLHDALVDKKAGLVIEEKFENELVEEAILLLPLPYRIPVVYKYYYDMSYEEIAKMLDKPIGTIKFRLNRAKRQLAIMLMPLFE